MKRRMAHWLFVSWLAVAGGMGSAAGLVIHNPWIVNDRVADTHNITTMGATYGNAYTPDGVIAPATNEDKAINIYNNQKRRLYHWANEPPTTGGSIDDPTYNQNVFGWCLCGRHSSNACTITYAAGLTPRRISFPGHWTYEVQYDGAWHQFDTMCTHYVYTRAPRHVASCTEIGADPSLELNAVAEDRACPGYLLCGDTADGYVSYCQHWGDSGLGTVATTWTGNMDLRSGQVFKRTWESWSSEHPTPPAAQPDPPFHHEANNDWKDYVNFPYWEPYRVDMPYYIQNANPPIKPTYRRWANGTDTLAPDFRSTAYQDLLYSSTNIATYNIDGLTPDLHANVVGTTAEAVFKISVPFYITDASFSGDFVRTSSGDVCNVQTSSNGTSWTTVWTDSTLGTTHIDNQSLRTRVFGLWQTWYIKVQFKASAARTDAGVSNFVVVTTFEHNKGAMAYLDKGVNHLTITCDNPQDLGSDWKMKVTYKWKEFDGADWTIDKTCVKYVSTSPATVTVITGGTKVPRTEYIQMELVPTPPLDTIAPAAVADLGPGGTPGRTSVPLAWTAPGNDGMAGEATGYDLRYSTDPIDASNFDDATPVTGVPMPRPVGGAETFMVTGLAPSTTYYFAVRAFDDSGNVADISNIISATTWDADPFPPNPVTDLAVATTATLGTYSLTWTAPADNGNGYVAAYDLRYATSPITEDTFSSATQIKGLPAPRTPGATEAFTATKLPTGVTIYFAIKAADDVGNLSAISNVVSARESIGTMTFQNGLNGYSGAQDSYMSAAATTTPYDGLEYLQLSGFADSTWTNQRRPIVKFDLGSLPTAAVITKATLYVYSYSNEQHDPTGGQYGAYHVYHPWAASSVCWNKPWSDHGGGDTDADPDAVADKQTTTGVWYAFDVTGRVQDYIVHPSNNNGWVIKCTNSGLHNQDWLYACEATTDVTLRPKLVVSDRKSGDIDNDGEVNLADLKLLVAAWNSDPAAGNWNADADLDADSAVNLADLKILVSRWNM